MSFIQQATQVALACEQHWAEQMPGPVCFQNTLLRVRSREGARPGFLRLMLEHERLQGTFAEASRGVGIHHLTSKRLAAVLSRCPGCPNRTGSSVRLRRSQPDSDQPSRPTDVSPVSWATCARASACSWHGGLRTAAGRRPWDCGVGSAILLGTVLAWEPHRARSRGCVRGTTARRACPGRRSARQGRRRQRREGERHRAQVRVC